MVEIALYSLLWPHYKHFRIPLQGGGNKKTNQTEKSEVVSFLISYFLRLGFDKKKIIKM